ncbi:hypothetical protein YYU_06195 [Anaplasma phagocytophilum str. HZ2]|uniref:Uncharacterized protein n=2 Tax=Anaplasma phagocytophilum TaxID=948 RepID=A0A098EER2_ANAPH|nr:hypothetical protein APH_1338 [Anaplasma phagocytophilum str. HZ]AGR79743.1 hypothetical protein YYU_06195 [Anaplasma phagocytophilum str. HZ2]AGR81003.1 hypothetical protein WSQ_06260 [Anaplasma phagocytophilum str. JM]AGR82260.1 hypothetical protein YYY_06275 [Anaplasma phagocytophilum str. Dog2]CEG20764.1 Uncharacterized protein ANAPHAGO_00820 [Anaplasma phagocytophilum]
MAGIEDSLIATDAIFVQIVLNPEVAVHKTG